MKKDTIWQAYFIIIIIIIINPLTTRVVVWWLCNQVPPFFPILRCPLGLAEPQACPFPDVAFPPLPLSALSSSPFHCALQGGLGQTWWTEDTTIALRFASLYDCLEVFVWSDCLRDLGTDFLIGNMESVYGNQFQLRLWGPAHAKLFCAWLIIWCTFQGWGGGLFMYLFTFFLFWQEHGVDKIFKLEPSQKSLPGREKLVFFVCLFFKEWI